MKTPNNNHSRLRVKLSLKDKFLYYWPAMIWVLMLALIEIILFTNHGEAMLKLAPFLYLIFLSFSLYDVLVGYSNLKFQNFRIQLTNNEISQIVAILSEVRNWKLIEITNNTTIAKSLNPSHLNAPTKIIIQNDSNSLKITSFLDPIYAHTSTSTNGERQRNLECFELAVDFLKSGESINQIPFKIQNEITKRKWAESEFSIKNIAKRIIAYLICVGLFALPIYYYDSLLFYPFLVMPVIGILYILLDLRIIRIKSST